MEKMGATSFVELVRTFDALSLQDLTASIKPVNPVARLVKDAPGELAVG